MTLVKFNNSIAKPSVSPRFVDVFDSFFNEAFLPASGLNKVPAVNIAESDQNFAVELAAPGLNKEDFKISIDKDVLTISADVKKDEKTEAKKYTKKEFGYSAFTRSFTLPEIVDQDKIEAEYTNGVLKLTLSKKEEVKLQAREIAIK